MPMTEGTGDDRPMIGDYLHEFAVVARRQNMAQAALELGLSTSSLARHMSLLESELQARLLERTSTGVRLTDDGRYAFSVAARITELGAELERSLAGGTPAGR